MKENERQTIKLKEDNLDKKTKVYAYFNFNTPHITENSSKTEEKDIKE